MFSTTSSVLRDSAKVNKAEGDSVDEGGVFDYISGGSVNVAHDCLLPVEQTVEQGALPTFVLSLTMAMATSLLQALPVSKERR